VTTPTVGLKTANKDKTEKDPVRMGPLEFYSTRSSGPEIQTGPSRKARRPLDACALALSA